MDLLRRVGLSPALVVAIVALVVAMGGLASSQTSAPEVSAGAISACVERTTTMTQAPNPLLGISQESTPAGAVRLIRRGGACGANEAPVTLNEIPPDQRADHMLVSTSKPVTLTGSMRQTAVGIPLGAGNYAVTDLIRITTRAALSTAEVVRCDLVQGNAQAVPSTEVTATVPAGLAGYDQTIPLLATVAGHKDGPLGVGCTTTPLRGGAHAAQAAPTSSPQMSLIQGTLNKPCLGVGKIGVQSVLALINVGVQDVPVLSSQQQQQCTDNSTIDDGADPLSHILDEIPVLSGNGSGNG